MLASPSSTSVISNTPLDTSAAAASASASRPPADSPHSLTARHHSCTRLSGRDSLESSRASFAGWTRTKDAYGHSVLVPRNSILLNPPQRKAYEALVFPAASPGNENLKSPLTPSTSASPLIRRDTTTSAASDSLSDDTPGGSSSFADATPGPSCEYPFGFPFRPAPVVTRIPEVVDKALEKEQREQRKREIEKEKERERERELQKAKEEEKIWGIPKKAFLGGLGGVGEVNFNAQIAMLGGWGNGSGGGSWSSVGSPAPPSHHRPQSRSGRVSGELERRKRDSVRLSPRDRDRQRERDRRERERVEREREEKEKAEAAAAEAAAEEEDPMDPEELAALNAIINTRRSMAAAQALANGQVRPGGGLSGTAWAGQREIVPCKVCAAASRADREGDVSMSDSENTDVSHSAAMDQSVDTISPRSVPSHTTAETSVSSLSSRAPESLSVDVHSANAPASDDMHSEVLADETSTCSSCQEGCTCPLRPHTCRALSADTLSPASGASSAGLFSWSAGGNKIRFAPLPGNVEEALSDERGRSGNAAGNGSRHSSVERTESIDESQSEDEEGEGWKRWYAPASTGGRGKWYLMGLPSSVFTPTRSKQRSSARDDETADEDEGSYSEHNSDMDHGSSNGHTTPGDSGIEAPPQSESSRRSRRLSTGTLGVVAAIEADRKGVTQAESLSAHGLMRSAAAVSEAETSSTARRSRSRKNSRPSSSSGIVSSSKRRRSTSRSRLSLSGSKSETEDLVDDDEVRARRSRLIRAARPGGTGMVTLPDGTKIPARKVDDASVGRASGGMLARRMSDADPEGDFAAEWGFAGLVRAQKEAQAQAEEDARAAEEQEAVKSPADNSNNKREADAATEVVKSDDTVLATPPALPAKSTSPPATSAKRSGLGLSVQQAEEVFRRHELEVEALGAEVRASMAAAAAHARAAVAAKANAGNAGSETSAMPTVTVQAPAGASGETGKAPAAEQEGGAASADAASKSGSGGPSSAASTLKVPSSKRGHGREESEKSFLARLGLRTRSRDPRQRENSNGSVHSTLTKTDSSSTTAPSPPASTLTPVASNLSTSPPSPRIVANKKMAVPAPSPRLPRRPDARGHVVVPLPQLGVRPERPVEGRVWRWDSEDDGSESEAAETEDEEEDEDADVEEGDEETRTSAAPAEGVERKSKSSKEHKADADAPLNAEQEAEEQRQAERQKARATTMAAGQEVVRAGTGAGKSSIGAGGDLARSKTRTVELKGAAVAAGASQRKGKSSSEKETEAKSPPAESERSTAAASGTATPSRDTLDAPPTPPRLRSAVSTPVLASPQRRPGGRSEQSSTLGTSNSSRSLSGSRIKDKQRRVEGLSLADLDDLDPDDPLSLADAELWPVTLAGSLSLGGGGTRGSVPARTPLTPHAAREQVARLAARARIARDRRTAAEKEKRDEEERKRIKRLQDPEHLDYGWPKSLQGSSLY